MSKYRLKSKDSTGWGLNKVREKDRREESGFEVEVRPEGIWEGCLEIFIIHIYQVLCSLVFLVLYRYLPI